MTAFSTISRLHHICVSSHGAQSFKNSLTKYTNSFYQFSIPTNKNWNREHRAQYERLLPHCWFTTIRASSKWTTPDYRKNYRSLHIKLILHFTISVVTIKYHTLNDYCMTYSTVWIFTQFHDANRTIGDRRGSLEPSIDRDERNRIISGRRRDRNLTESGSTLPGIDGPSNWSRRTSTMPLDSGGVTSLR